jgi:hypothetical protein
MSCTLPDLGTRPREFGTGATRDTDENKLDPEGFLSVDVLQCYFEYMHAHRKVGGSDKLRDSDNWQSGIPRRVYIKSLWRHFFDVWREMRGRKSREGLTNALCGVLFNTMGLLHEVLLNRNVGGENG